MNHAVFSLWFAAVLLVLPLETSKVVVYGGTSAGVVAADGHVQNEGDVQEWQRMDAYPISYRAIVPKGGQCENLPVPLCLSACHIAYGSFRMEPVYMIFRQSAATAATHAIDDGVAVRDVNYERFARRLRRDGQILDRD
jgi:hypothetical protein